jgi:hypothetical protein
MGRFLSPDWSAKEEPVPYAKLDNPQTLNLYSYVQNNPLIRIDEDGHDALKIVDTRTGHVTILIPVHMTGRGATKERVHEILQRANHVHSEDPKRHCQGHLYKDASKWRDEYTRHQSPPKCCNVWCRWRVRESPWGQQRPYR